jgi:predicted nucleic acid-binding protein
MPAKIFVDSNVLIYAFDASEGPKRHKADATLAELWAHDSGVLSVQVLQEFYNNVTRKIRQPLAKSEAQDVVEEYAVWCASRNVQVVQAAFLIEAETRFSFWDSLIVASAQASGADRILSEDMQHGQVVGGVEIVNPFLGL